MSGTLKKFDRPLRGEFAPAATLAAPLPLGSASVAAWLNHRRGAVRPLVRGSATVSARPMRARATLPHAASIDKITVSVLPSGAYGPAIGPSRNSYPAMTALSTATAAVPGASALLALLLADLLLRDGAGAGPR